VSDLPITKSRKRTKDEKLAETRELSRAWKIYQQERLDAALASAHGVVVAELMVLLDRLELNSAATLLDAVRRTDWSDVSYDIRLTLLHQVNQAITRLRERNGMPAIDDPLPDQPDNVFRRIKQLMFAAPPGAHPGLNQMQQRNDERVKYE
jgi:hypothetical protein